MRVRWDAVYALGVKELRSLRRDYVMLFLIVFSFTFSIYTAAKGMSVELLNASLAVVDEDRSPLTLRLRGAFLRPHFKTPAEIPFSGVDPGMDRGLYTFVLVFPPRFQADLLAGRRPEVQLDVDATAVMQAGLGAAYIRGIVAQETRAFLRESGRGAQAPARLQVRYAFNPTVDSSWFTAIMELINHVTVLAIILTGAALIREREHGTLEHLLAMPLTPFEILAAKVWANGLVVLAAVALSLWLVVERLLAIPIAGSIPLFLAGVALYLFFASALGIFLGMLARTMPRFGLLYMLVILPMILLSGGQTPLESQPPALRAAMQLVPSTHFVAFAQAILYRGAGLAIVWPGFAAVLGIGGALFVFAALHFRRGAAEGGGEGG